MLKLWLCMVVFSSLAFASLHNLRFSNCSYFEDVTGYWNRQQWKYTNLHTLHINSERSLTFYTSTWDIFGNVYPIYNLPNSTFLHLDQNIYTKSRYHLSKSEITFSYTNQMSLADTGYMFYTANRRILAWVMKHQKGSGYFCRQSGRWKVYVHSSYEIPIVITSIANALVSISGNVINKK